MIHVSSLVDCRIPGAAEVRPLEQLWAEASTLNPKQEQKAVLLVVGLAFLAGASSSSAAAGHLRSTALANQPGSMRLRGGMATMAEQMAEIRAKKAQQYAAVKDEHSSDVLASETKDSSGAQADWMLAQDKVGPESISTKGHSMEIGDARNIYLGQGVTVLRNKRTGMAVEFLHESKGWFYLRPRCSNN